MLPILYNTNNIYTPPSSPPSSPSLYLDSSPPSSPGHDPRSLDSDWEADVDCASRSSSPIPFGTPIDPLSGAYRSVRTKRRSTELTPLQKSYKKARFRSRSRSPHPSEDEHSSLLSPAGEDKYRQKLLWDDALENMFQGGERKIDLSHQNLAEIPSQAVIDLGKIVVLPEKNEPIDDLRLGLSSPTPGPSTGRRVFDRTQTAPASSTGGFLFGRIGPPAKTMSSNSVLGMSREAMNIFLGRNNISKLPMELWNLHNLTVLSLRHNCITYIPPEIARLTELQDCNLANNKIQFIPSEMLAMKKLTRLNIFPNPFLPEPRWNREGKLVSETDVKGPRTPSLTELLLRVLVGRPTPTSETLLQRKFELPLVTGPDQRPITAFRKILNVCVPGSISPDEAPEKRRWELEDDAEVTGSGVCPNPRHSEPCAFIQPTEVRYTWESSTVSIKSLGGTAAVQWRGCLRGCLAFLGPPPEAEQPRDDNAQVASDDGMEINLEESEVVQTVRFEAGAELGFED